MATPFEHRLVWVVDDSPLDAERARRALVDMCQVEVFQDGAAALERLAAVPSPPHVMVLDWVMPDVTGLDVCRFLRSAQGGYPGVGILLLTTHRHTEQIVEGLSAGANDYLAKPFEEAELRARIVSLLRAGQLLERAEHAEAMNRRLLETAPDALIAVDAAGKVAFVNETARLALETATGSPLDRPLADVLPGFTLSADYETGSVARRLPDVKIGAHLFSPTLRMLESGQAYSTIISLRDVTERRQLDARRLDFYSVIAHDLRSPLSTLTLRTQLLLQGGQGPLSDDVRAAVGKIDGNLKSLVDMINDFLDLARLDCVAYEIDGGDVDVGELLAKTVDEMRPQFDARELSWSAEVEDVRMLGDARRMQQVLTNLISNAVKFTPRGGAISARVVRIADQVEVSIIDTGRGIPAHFLATLFDRYTRAVDTQYEVPGTGLGLMIVREIVEAHGGSVGVESTVGVGSRFWFRVPCR